MNGWHRTIASWILFQAGRAAHCAEYLFDWPAQKAADAHQRLMACSVELDVEGRIWRYVGNDKAEE